MKNIIRCNCFILFLLVLTPYGVQAHNDLWIDSVSMGPKQLVHLSLKVSNTDTIVAFQCDIVLPAQLTYVANSAQLTSRSNSLSLAATLISSNTLRVIAYSLSGAAVQGYDGAVLTFDCVSGILPGTFSIHPANALLSNPAQQNVLTGIWDGQFVLLAPSIKTNADSIDFGSIPLGQSTDLAVTIDNVGNMPLSLQGISSTLTEITATDSSSIIINANSSTIRTLRFQPVKKGTKIGVISLKSNDPQDSMKAIKVRGIAYAVNEIHAGTAMARSGYQTKLRLSVNNMEPFNAFQCALHLPSVMKYVEGSAVLQSRKVDHAISADTIGNSLNIISYSPSNSAYQGNNGDVLELTFLITGQGGTYTIPINGGILTDSTGTNIISASYNGSLQIAAPKLQLSTQLLSFGSVSSVCSDSQSFSIRNTGTDTLILSSMAETGVGFSVNETLPLILSPNQSDTIQVVFSSAYEGAHSGSITIRNNDVTNDPAVVSLSGTIFIPTILFVEQDTLLKNWYGFIRIGLWNLKPVTAVQFDLTMPSGLIPSIDSLQKTLRVKNHILLASSLGQNAYRCIVYSPTSAVLNDSIGDIMKIPVYASCPSGSYPIQLQNVSISDTSGHNISTGQQNGTIRINDYALSLRASIVNSHILLEWTSVHGASGYNVYRGTQYNFVPDIVVGSNRVAAGVQDADVGVPGIQWTDLSTGVAGDTTTHHFWRVTAIGGSAESLPSNAAGEFTYPLHSTPGTSINEIVVGMDTRASRNPVLNAEDLANAIPYCTTVYVWEAHGQGFVGHVKGLPFNNFPVNQGYPYAVNVPADTIWTVAGCVPDTNFHLITTPVTNINHIGIHFSKSNLTNADSLVRDIPGGTTVYYWSAAAQGTIGHAKGFPFNNFSVKPGYPYYVNVLCDSVWPAAPSSASNSITLSKKEMNDRFKYINTLSKKNLSANSNVINTTTGNRLSGGVPHMVYGKYKGRISGGMKMRVWVASRTDEVLIESMVGTGTDSTYWWSNVGTFPTPWKAGELLEVELEDSTNKMGGSTSIKLTNDGSDCAEVIHVNTPVRILGIDWDGSDIPKEYSLVGNFPNPFNPTTTLMYGVPVDSKVKLEVFNMLGQLVAVLADEVKQTGYYTVTFGSQGLPSGVYFYRMTAGSFMQTKKMQLIK
jgi:hypothetical protein